MKLFFLLNGNGILFLKRLFDKQMTSQGVNERCSITNWTSRWSRIEHSCRDLCIHDPVGILEGRIFFFEKISFGRIPFEIISFERITFVKISSEKIYFEEISFETDWTSRWSQIKNSCRDPCIHDHVGILEGRILGENIFKINLFKINLVRRNLQKSNLLKSNLLERNPLERKPLKGNLRERNLLKRNLLKRNILKRNPLERNPYKGNLLKKRDSPFRDTYRIMYAWISTRMFDLWL